MGHAMGGKKLDSSASSDALKMECMSKLSKLLLLSSKGPMVDRDRFKLLIEIMGRSSPIMSFRCRRSFFRASSSAAVAGATRLEMMIEVFMSTARTSV
jgi:hypothetical protein